MINLIAALALAAASPFTPPLGARPPVLGPRTQVLTVGSPHLSEIKSIKPDMADPLIARLATFRPTIITIEGVSGEQCDLFTRYAKYKDVLETYCVDAGPARKATGLTQAQADEQSDALLTRWSTPGTPAPTASDRRKAALLLLAANERGSAWVQWLRLPLAERIAADGLDADMVKGLNREGRPANESYVVAAQLAARLGLERLYPVDDHSSDGALSHLGKPYEDALTARFARFRTDPMYIVYSARRDKVVDGGTLLDFYRFLNSPAAVDESIHGDFGGALTDRLAAPFGRSYVAWWEVRNLRMAANIRAAFAEHPGARVLNIVGSSHAPWYNSLMRQMADVEVVPLTPYLR